jgi:23S rRNA (uridine2552-2'-O)-methyltransferase
MSKRDDHYARLARAKGYPARSVFKLEEMQRRFHLVKPRSRILDIGSTPGSWSLFVLRELRGRVIGVDLNQTGSLLNDKEGFTFIRGDILRDEVKDRILTLGPYDAVLSDAAPATTGNRLVDTQRSLELAERVFHIALACLRVGGNLVIKVFQGGDENELRRQMKERFRTVRSFRPKACRKESFENYLLGLGFIEKSA